MLAAPADDPVCAYEALQLCHDVRPEALWLCLFVYTGRGPTAWGS